MLAQEPRKNVDLVGRLRAERGMPALARDHVPTTLDRHQRRHAKAGTGPERDLDAGARFTRLAKRTRVIGAEPRQRPGDRLEIVDDAHGREAEAPRERAPPKSPRAISERDLVAAVDRSGDG